MSKPIDWLSKQKWLILDKYDEKRGIYFATDEFIHRFVYFGELGYGLMSFFPYLNFLVNVKRIKIETCGPVGSSAFFYFSSKHTELPINTVPGLGDRATAMQALKLSNYESFFSPRTMTPSYLLASDETMCWRGLEGGRIQPHHGGYLNLNYEFNESFSPAIEECLQKDFVLVNIKNHFNWNNDSIPNFYGENEILELSQIARKKGLYLYINDVQVPLEASEIGFENRLKDRFGDLQDVLFLSEFYKQEENVSERTKIQFQFMQKAKRIYASQGGNAALSIINNRNVTVLMRGGFDWPDYVNLSQLYSTNLEVIYEIWQSKSFLNSEF